MRYWPSRNPPLPGPLAVRIAAAGGAARLAVQVLNHGNRLAAVAVQVTRADPWAGHAWAGGSWVRLVPERDGYWAWPGRQAAGPSPGRGSVRVTDVLGAPGRPAWRAAGCGRAAGPADPAEPGLDVPARRDPGRAGGAAARAAASTPAAACRPPSA